MNSTPPRHTGNLVGAAIAAAAGFALATQAGPAQPGFWLTVMWLILLGWGFVALLRRQLGLGDRALEAETRLELERKTRALAERALADTHSALCKLIQQQELVRETERNRIARDIHDDLGQQLLAFKIELSLLQVSTHGAHPQLNDKLGAMLHSLDRTIGSLRAVINDLRPLALELGLRCAFETQLREFTRVNGIHHELSADPAAFEGAPDRASDAMLLRVLQESLANVARHAQATEVRVRLGCAGGRLTLSVQDNGIGMAGQPDARGCGLAGMRDRVSAAGGTFLLDSEPGAGTLISLSIPVVQPAAA